MVVSETNFGGKFIHKAAGVTDLVTEVGTVSVNYDDTAVMSASMDTMSGILTINSVNTAAGSCSRIPSLLRRIRSVIAACPA